MSDLRLEQKAALRPELRIFTQAPSNIALIKYMGKKDSDLNIPENPSLSLTLRSLCTVVEISFTESEKRLAGESSRIRWFTQEPRAKPEFLTSDHKLVTPLLTEAGVARLHAFIAKATPLLAAVLKQYAFTVNMDRWENSHIQIRTANTFPASSGIASSASSFAGLTLAIAGCLVEDAAVFKSEWERNVELKRSIAGIARQGSGSSCRSFEGPWVYWKDQEASRFDGAQTPELAHFVILVDTSPKKISSSKAHTVIHSSPLWTDRVKRVETRMGLLKRALREGSLDDVAKVTWSEAWEMHSLFHTSSEPFSYWVPGTMDVLHWFAPLIKEAGAPIVTLDAGPNIHVIVDETKRSEWRSRLQEQFPNYRLLEDASGTGAGFL